MTHAFLFILRLRGRCPGNIIWRFELPQSDLRQGPADDPCEHINEPYAFYGVRIVTSNYSMFLTEWPPLWSSSQSSWLQIQRPGFDSRRNQIFWEVVGLERDPLSLVSTIEELLRMKKWRLRSTKTEITAVEIRRADYATPSIRKNWH
jgi:hypothetical protein